MIYQTHLINLAQLQNELTNAGLQGIVALSIWGTMILQIDAQGDPHEIAAQWQYVQDAHVAMRDKTLAEYQTEYSTATADRKLVINELVNGLIPPEQVPDTTPWPPARMTTTVG